MFFYSCFTEYLSIDGAIRVISDDFSISLLNPDSELYRYKADKYATMVRFFYGGWGYIKFRNFSKLFKFCQKKHVILLFTIRGNSDSSDLPLKHNFIVSI